MNAQRDLFGDGAYLPRGFGASSTSKLSRGRESVAETQVHESSQQTKSLQTVPELERRLSPGRIK